jgi:hypothetical protein
MKDFNLNNKDNNNQMTSSIVNYEFLESIWNDANFTPSKKPIVQTGEAQKRDKIRKINNEGKIVAYCKQCNCEMYISTNYNGEFPLCRLHRDPNDRIKFN